MTRNVTVLDHVPDDLMTLALEGDPGRGAVADLAVPVPVLPGSATCQELELPVGRDARLSSLLVRHPEVGGLVGVVQRRRFDALMSGPFGYGRALHSRNRATDVAQ